MRDHRQETKVVKAALKAAGIKASVTHGKGTAYNWLHINLGNPEERGGTEPHPDGWRTRYTEAEVKLHGRVLGMVQSVTGRGGAYNGDILITASD